MPNRAMPNQRSATSAINIALGIWLIISAYLWPHTQGQFDNTWIVGVLSVLFGVLSMWASQARYLNVILAVWLFISAWAIPSGYTGTVWNNVLVSIAMLIASLLPSAPTTPEVRRTTAPPPP